MRTNLNKTNLTLRNSLSLPTLRAVLMVLLIAFGAGNAWAHDTHYGKAVLQNQTGHGTVYLSTASGSNSGQSGSSNPGTVGGQSWITWNCGGSSDSDTKTYYARYSAADDGWYFAGWSDNSNATSYTASTTGKTFTKATSTNQNSPTTSTIYGFFKPVTVTAAPSNVNINATDPSATYNDAAGTVVSFTTANSNKIGDFTTSESGDARWVISAWTRASASSATFNYKFVGNGSYGTNNRTFTKTVTLTSKGDASSTKTCTLTAKYPNPRVVACDAEATDLTIYPTFKAADATQAAVEKTAVFDVVYADNGNNFTASFSGANGGGTWTVTNISVDQSNQKATVTYTFNGNKAEGTHTAVLTLTANNCQGWDDTSAAGGASATVTLTAENTQEATDDAKVIAKDGTTLIYQGDWVTALGKANTAANAGCTLQLLRNVHLNDLGLTSTQGITNTFTLDLNGKVLSGEINGSVLNPKTSGKTLTIKDSKTGGKIQNISNYNGVLYAINLSAGTLNVESGYVYVENQAQYAYGTSTYTDGTPNKGDMQARAIHMAATSTVNVSGGKIHAVSSRNAFGIREESSKANNTTLNITGGEVIGEAPAYAYGIYASGKVNISGGSVTALLNDKTVDGNTTYTANAWNDYTLHRYGYGIQMFASSNATAANCYFGTLTITGGTINAINVNATTKSDGTLQSEHTYGIYMNVSATGAGAGKTAPDGTKVMKACAIGSMENATVNVTHAGSLGYGVMAVGSYNSFDNKTTPFTIKNSTINVTTNKEAYGVYASAYVNWNSTLTKLTGNGGCTRGDIELTNTTINATAEVASGAYCAWASCTSGTVANAKATTGSTSEGNATYYGEYAVAGKITVNSGTFTADAKTSSAYGIGSSDRAKCVRNVNGVFANRDAVADPQGSLSDYALTSDAEAYPELYIHGGNFSATTGTSTAVAVKSGGTTLIDGGTFNAFAGTSDAYGLKINSGVTTANGVTFPASATTKAYGVYITGTVSDWSLFAYAGEAILNNCNVTATTRTTTEARAVYIDGATKTYTQASFDAMKSANNSNYKNYGDYAQVGERSIMGRATINGGTYSATAETTTAYGAVLAATKVSTNAIAVASGNLEIHDAKFIVKTNGTTTAIGVYAGGPTIIDGCDITVQPKTGTAKGVHAYDKKTTITNTKFDVKATTEARLFYAEAAIGSTTGWDYHGEFELGEGNECVATATGGNTAHILTLLATKKNIASGTFAGDYANATSALVTGGSYKATATGTTCYAVNLSAEQVQGAVKAAPTCTIEDGKFWALASGGTTGICSTNGVAGNILFKGGVYNVNTTLSKHIPEGLEEVPLASDRPEYTEGYRYEIAEAGMHGIDVCQIGSTKYKSLEEALQVVTSGQVIYMIANYTMASPGDYVLPANTTLLIPYKTGSGKGATTAIGNAAETTTSATTPVLFRKLTFGNGVNLVCYGTIETSAQQKANGQYNANVGMPSGAYGQIQMDEGSHISMESGSRLNCWGYITGKGTINVKNNATVLEGFQLGDWCGGTNATTLTGSSNKGKAFPITHYFYQSIECPITYRPGAKALGSTHVNMSFVGTVGQDAVPLVGTSDAMFIMDNVNASEDTWVMKDYDEENDYCYWTINSGASIGNLIVKIPNAIDVNSADYVLPICSNMAVVLNYGEGSIGQHAVFLPGSKLIINKEGTLVLSGVNVSALDLTEYTGATIYRASYSPTWGTTNPRSTSVVDAEVFVHGKVELKNNGGLYTSASGANIHSTNSDAGQVLYTSAAQGDKTTYYLKSSATSATAVTVNAAKLRNEDNTYSSTGGTAAKDVWVYVNGKWTKKTKEGCFSVETTDKKHYYIQPSDIVEVNYPAQSNHTYTSVTGGRVFVWDEDCYWWEVETEPTPEGYYKAITPNHNGKYNYYYYDSSAACWKIKTITVTWNINGSNTNYSVGYGTKPEWLGATPTKTSSSSNYVWRWDGWTQGSSTEVIDNKELPIVTQNTTFTAHFYEKYYEYNIIFKNSDGTILDSRNWRAGTTPSYEGTPTKNPTAAETYEFNGSWSPAIATVTKSATYVANYTSYPRAYTITFLNYDMSELGTAEVVYNGTPSNATYLAAVAPLTEDPYKPDNSAFSFEFAGWRLQGASSNGFAQVKGDQTYIAQFNQTTKKYKISFVDDDGETVLHYLQLEYGQTPSYTWDNPANKQDVEWTYAFTGWDPEEFTVVEGPQTYTANYSKTHRFYTITWIDGDGNALTTTNVEYGTTPTYPGTPAPTKTATNTIIYTFNNTWSPALKPVTGEATYTAQFNESERTYALTIGVNDAEFGSVSPTPVTGIPYNAAITVNGNSITVNGTTVTATPTAATAQYTYTFSSWSNVPGNVTADVSNIQAVFTRTVNTYNVTFNANGHGTAPSAITNVEYNSTISAPAAPSETGWTFGGWYKEEGCTNAWNFGTDKVTGATTLYAKWTQNKYNFTISVASESAGYGSVSPASVTEIPHGALVTTDENTFTVNGTTVIATPSSATERYIYEFYDWENLPQTATEDVSTIQAVFTRTERQYTITWKNFDDETIKIDYLEYGETPSFDEDPTYGPTISTIYTFNGWDNEIVAVTGDATYTATYTESPRVYPVLWKDYDGNTLGSSQRTYGEPAPYASDFSGLLPTRPSENGKVYTFSGWSDPVSVVGGCDVTYTALYRVDLLAEESSGPVEIDTDIEVETTTVRVSGHLSIAPGAKLTTTDLVIEASKGASGEITGNIEDVTATNVYFDYAVESDGRHWNVFGVPFEIGDLDAVKLQYKNSGETSWKPMTLGTHYDIIYYDEATRAAQGPVSDCWKYVEDQPAGQRTLQPGIAYSITLLYPVDTLRFTKANSRPIEYPSAVNMTNSNTEDATKGGWNGIANPKTYHALLDAGVLMIQIHDGGEIGRDGYDSHPIGDYKFVVGKAGYVQVPSANSVLNVTTAGDQPVIPAHIAARRTTAETSELYTVEFNAEGTQTDRVYVRTEEGKSDEYTVGSDVMKMSVSSVRPQLWVDRYNMKLCMNTVAPIDGQAAYPLGLYAPAAGEYTIALQPTEDDTNTIYLTCDGVVIWNLTYSPYLVQLEKGTNARYGLQIVHAEAPAVTTGIVDAQAGTQPTAQKVLLNDKVYILRGTNVYTVEGQMVK